MATVNFVLIGHVDNGKTTCAGRILVDTKTIDEREVEKAIEDATNNGMRSWWLAYLLDIGEERKKGKTHEHTVIPIEYKGIKVNLIDVPGHRKYVKEMIAGTSLANLAVLICSAKKGEVESGIKGQTYEHLLLARAMGIGKLIVAINKMDHESVMWDMNIYEDVKNKISKLISNLNFNQVQYIPISALEGTNVVNNDINNINNKSLMDLIITTKINPNRIIQTYEKQKKIKIKCKFMNIETIITPGYSCNIHSNDQVSYCTIKKIYSNKPFISNIDASKGVIDVDIELAEPIDIKTFVLLRDGDKTIGIGKIVVK